MSHPYNKVTALTGLIGSGKSLAAKYFSDCGATLVSADLLARKVVEPGTKGYKKILDNFGARILNEDGTINRKLLGAEIFSKEGSRLVLEKITHPLIQKEARNSFERELKQGPALLIYDCPLFFEAGLDSMGYRNIILVAAPRDLCISRIMKRDGYSHEEASRRVDSQIPIELKRQGSTHVIENDKDKQDLRNSVIAVYQALT
jgi:dephospho-CoA kinase